MVRRAQRHWRACAVGRGDSKLEHDGGGGSDKAMAVLYH
jgi:hypothetical protein